MKIRTASKSTSEETAGDRTLVIHLVGGTYLPNLSEIVNGRKRETARRKKKFIWKNHKLRIYRPFVSSLTRENSLQSQLANYRRFRRTALGLIMCGRWSVFRGDEQEINVGPFVCE